MGKESLFELLTAMLPDKVITEINENISDALVSRTASILRAGFGFDNGISQRLYWDSRIRTQRFKKSYRKLNVWIESAFHTFQRVGFRIGCDST